MIDLHAHTDRSDGSTDPGDLVRLAVREGIEALAIADHDTFAGYDAALPTAALASSAREMSKACCMLDTDPLSHSTLAKWGRPT